MPVILASWEGGRITVQAGWSIKVDPIKKQPKQKGTLDMPQVVQHLPSKHNVLSSNPSSIKKYFFQKKDLWCLLTFKPIMSAVKDYLSWCCFSLFWFQLYKVGWSSLSSFKSSVLLRNTKNKYP
jgi:hypothetical protein